ncbi:hypothetical protein JCM8547_007449 [Rhodosporidiobolus lusitaniae]
MDRQHHKDGPHIFRLPPEIGVHALAFAGPASCARFSRCSRAAKLLVDSAALWRELHRNLYDPHPKARSASASSPQTSRASSADPSSSQQSASSGDTASSAVAVTYDHRFQVQCRTRTITLLKNLAESAIPIPAKQLELVLSTLVDLAQSRSPYSPTSHSLDSLNEFLLEQHLPLTAPTLLALHPTFSRSSLRSLRSQSKQPAFSAELLARSRIAQLAAHLHVLSTPSLLALSSPSIRTAAREIVYEKLNASRMAAWGPFMNDGSGRIDWRKVEALALVMTSNMSDAEDLGWGSEEGDEHEGGRTVVPRGWKMTRPESARVRTDKDGRDWAGIESQEWRGTYAFLHFPVWHHYNFHRSPHYAPSLAEEHEAVGDCMALSLKLLPEGEWPAEIDGPDLSHEAFDAQLAADDEQDGDFVLDGEVSDTSASSDSEGDAYFTTTSAAGPSRTSPRRNSTGSNDAAAGPSASTSTSTEPTHSQPAVAAGRYLPVTIPGTSRTSTTPVPASSDEEDAASNGSTTSPYEGFDGPGPLSPGPPLPEGWTAPPFDTTFKPSSLSSAPQPSSSSQPSTSSSPSAASSSSTAYPKLAFTGTSHRLAFAGTFLSSTSTSASAQTTATSQFGSDRTIRGTVERANDGSGAVRWNFLIRYSGVDQWQLSGVQVSVGSRMGVLGVWSAADRAPEGPCGPFWYWPHCPDDPLA